MSSVSLVVNCLGVPRLEPRNLDDSEVLEKQNNSESIQIILLFGKR